MIFLFPKKKGSKSLKVVIPQNWIFHKSQFCISLFYKPNKVFYSTSQVKEKEEEEEDVRDPMEEFKDAMEKEEDEDLGSDEELIREMNEPDDEFERYKESAANQNIQLQQAIDMESEDPENNRENFYTKFLEEKTYWIFHKKKTRKIYIPSTGVVPIYSSGQLPSIDAGQLGLEEYESEEYPVEDAMKLIIGLGRHAHLDFCLYVERVITLEELKGLSDGSIFHNQHLLRAEGVPRKYMNVWSNPFLLQNTIMKRMSQEPRDEQMIIACKRLCELDKTEDALLNYFNALLEEDRNGVREIEQAEKILQEITLDQSAQYYYLAWSVLHDAKGEREDAVKKVWKALKMAPTDTEVATQVVHLLGKDWRSIKNKLVNLESFQTFLEMLKEDISESSYGKEFEDKLQFVADSFPRKIQKLLDSIVKEMSNKRHYDKIVEYCVPLFDSKKHKIDTGILIMKALLNHNRPKRTKMFARNFILRIRNLPLDEKLDSDTTKKLHVIRRLRSTATQIIKAKEKAKEKKQNSK